MLIEPPPSSWRKGVGVALICGLIMLWAAAILMFAPYVARWPVLIQAILYLIVGISWVIPLKPLIRWSETGAWRKDGLARMDD